MNKIILIVVLQVVDTPQAVVVLLGCLLNLVQDSLVVHELAPILAVVINLTIVLHVVSFLGLLMAFGGQLTW